MNLIDFVTIVFLCNNITMIQDVVVTLSLLCLIFYLGKSLRVWFWSNYKAESRLFS